MMVAQQIPHKVPKQVLQNEDPHQEFCKKPGKRRHFPRRENIPVYSTLLLLAALKRFGG